MPLSPLPLRVAIFDDEPAWSLAMRLSRRQGNDHIKSFCSEHELSWNDVMMGRASASVAQMAGADEGAIERATPVRNAKGEAVLRGERIADWDFGTENIGVCPGCLREDLAVLPGPPEYRTHWRAWWKLRFARTCPFHRMRLVCERPDGGALDALAGDPRRAAGPGVDLADAISEPVNDVQGETYLLGRLGYGPRTSMPILDALPFKAAVRALDRFGAVATGGLRAYTSFDGEVDPHDALAAGAAIFVEGREGVDRFLDRLVADNEPERGQWGPRQAYGQIYAWLERERYAGEDDLKPIRDIVAAHALRTIPVNPNEELFGEKIGERRLFALHHVWKETGIHTSRLRAVLQGLGLIGEAEAVLPDWSTSSGIWRGRRSTRTRPSRSLASGADPARLFSTARFRLPRSGRMQMGVSSTAGRISTPGSHACRERRPWSMRPRRTRRTSSPSAGAPSDRRARS
jgi:hypothetical protein